MEQSAARKGFALEQAIELIERSILSRVPGLSDKSYKIYSRKIISVDDVKHEIDIWVEFDIGGDYKSIFIFEAKNWNKKVGKNEPIIFAKKIEAAQAQRGFFVAKAFTKDALAAAKLEPRMTILEVTDSFPISDITSRFHSLTCDRSTIMVNIDVKAKMASSEGAPISIDAKTATSLLNESPINLESYFLKKVYSIVEENNNRLPTHTFPDGIYPYDLEKEILIAPDSLIINTVDIEKIKFKIKYQIGIVRPPIVSKYEIKTRGRVYTFGEVKVGERGSVQISLIETFRQ